jgi:TolA-binding protein
MSTQGQKSIPAWLQEAREAQAAHEAQARPAHDARLAPAAPDSSGAHAPRTGRGGHHGPLPHPARAHAAHDPNAPHPARGHHAHPPRGHHAAHAPHGHRASIATPSQHHSGRVVGRSLLVCAFLIGAVVIGSRVPKWLDNATQRHTSAPTVESTLPLDELLQGIEAAADSSATNRVVELCTALVDRFPDHPVAEPALLRLVQANIRLRDERGIAQAFQMLRARYPHSRLLPEAFLDVASWRFQEHEFAAAASTYTDLVALVTSGNGSPAGEDTAPEPVIWRSKALWNAHQRDIRSQTELERLARFDQALSYENGGDRESAVRAYDRFISRFPQDAFVPEARFRMAGLLLAEGRKEEALASYRRVYEDPLAAVAFRCESAYRAGREFQTDRRFEEALAAYRVTQSLQPADNEFRLAALGELAQLLEVRDPKQALALYRELVKTSTSTGVRAVALQRLAVLGGDRAASRP